MRLLWVCALTVLTSADSLAQQGTEVAFDPTPVALSQTDSGKPRLVTSKDLLSLREVHGLSISPDGSLVAFVVGEADYDTNSYRSGLFVVRTSGTEPPRRLGSAGMPHWTSFNEWISEPPQWSRNSRIIFYRMRMHEAEPWQVWQWNTDTGAATPLTRVPGDVVRYAMDSSAERLAMQVELRADSNSLRSESDSLGRHAFHSESPSFRDEAERSMGT
jgi:Tol biopolymer transport system component